VKKSELRGLIPCLLLVLAGMLLFAWFFWAALKSAS
jgi:hypothetical protein